MIVYPSYEQMLSILVLTYSLVTIVLITNPEQKHTISGANGALFVHSCAFRIILTPLWSD